MCEGWVDFIFELVTRTSAPRPGWVASLYHKICNNPVKDKPIVIGLSFVLITYKGVIAFGKAYKISYSYRCFVLLKANNQVSFGSLHLRIEPVSQIGIVIRFTGEKHNGGHQAQCHDSFFHGYFN